MSKAVLFLTGAIFIAGITLSFANCSDSEICYHSENYLHNDSLLLPFFKKLQNIEQGENEKVRIVHIGDSHIQGGAFSGTARKIFQDHFGIAGFGFVFPYNLIGTSAGLGNNLRFMSNAFWETCKVQSKGKCANDKALGLSGYGFYTADVSAIVSLEIANDDFDFNKIDLFFTNDSQRAKTPFLLALSEQVPFKETVKKSSLKHKVKKGETISQIAEKYKTSVTAIRNENKKRNNKIYTGEYIKIPAQIKKTELVDMNIFNSVAFSESNKFAATYKSDSLLSKIYILANGAGQHFLNGINIEGNNSGVIYSSIGVNGSKISDFLETPLFFEQLSYMKPDIVIVSFGTNDAFSSVHPEVFSKQVNLFASQLKQKCSNAVVILTTPPISVDENKEMKEFLPEYTLKILNVANSVVFDLNSLTRKMSFDSTGNFDNSKNFLAKDGVHYSHSAYTAFGEILANSILEKYKSFRTRRVDASSD